MQEFVFGNVQFQAIQALPNTQTQVSAPSANTPLSSVMQTLCSELFSFRQIGHHQTHKHMYLHPSKDITYRKVKCAEWLLRGYWTDDATLQLISVNATSTHVLDVVLLAVICHPVLWPPVKKAVLQLRVGVAMCACVCVCASNS
jgi:hypothetical protein